ncbi:hypothetical protein A2U01_0013713, partial [Trifolium medium]|nr:hypothetical protein [Trifolium medium]
FAAAKHQRTLSEQRQGVQGTWRTPSESSANKLAAAKPQRTLNERRQGVQGTWRTPSEHAANKLAAANTQRAKDESQLNTRVSKPLQLSNFFA